MTDSTILQPEGLEQRYERYKEKIKHFTIMNDIFMRNVLKEISCTEYILQVIMNRTGLKVIDQTLRRNISRWSTYSICKLEKTGRYRIRPLNA